MPEVIEKRRRPLRILYAAGPGDVVGTYRHWKEGRDDPSQVAVTYSGQFYDLCRDLGAEGYVISYCPRPDKLRDGPFRVRHRKVPFMHSAGPLYLLGQMWSGLRFTATAIRFRADVAVVMSGMIWWSLSLLPLFGTKVVPTLHAQLWRVNHPQRGVSRFIWWLNRAFFRKTASAVIYISDSVLHQLEGLTGPLDVPLLYFVPTYREGSFRRGEEARSKEPPPFRVLYAGRVERDKGVFDLLEVARRFIADGRPDIEFDLCGEGSALDDLRRQADKAGLSARFRCHGHMNKSDMRRMYGDAHAVVVPTTTASVEGLNKVVIESVLAGRPVITSTICPAIEYVRAACVEVPPDDVRAYGDAILRLANDKDFYEQKRQNCAAAGGQFYDPGRGWGATFRRVLESIGVLANDAGCRSPGAPAQLTDPAAVR